MFVYRVVKAMERTADLSGTGAYKYGGRWNSRRTYMLYTSENSSLAFLETLVHFEEEDYPPSLFISKIKIDDAAAIYKVPEKEYPRGWMRLDHLKNKAVGDVWMKEMKYLAFKVRSAINNFEHNYLFNPLYPGFHDLVKLIEVTEIRVDQRLL